MSTPALRHVLLAAFAAVVVTACFSAVPEGTACTTDSQCGAGQKCLNSACTTVGDDGGAGGGAGGGVAGGGGGDADAGQGGGAGGGDADAGQGGGTGGGAMGGGAGGGAPDAGVCGCNSALGCQPGDSPLACGNGGAATMCVNCGLGEQCVNGACVMAPCGPMTCSGCCTNNFCVTPSQQNRFACGTGGAACNGCPMGQTCTNGACMTPPPCDATTCPTGCCQNGQCVAGTMGRACGTGGAACQACGFGNMCVAGACQTPDGGAVMPVPAGSACTSSQACQPPQGAFCIQESSFGQPSGYMGGYCTAQCGANAPCQAGDVCVTEPVFGISGSSCRASCSAPGMGQSTCRTGYVCAAVAGTTTGYCRPNCNNGGLAACPMGQMCDAMTGYCQ